MDKNILKTHYIHFSNHKTFVDHCIDLGLKIVDSQQIIRRFGDPLYKMTIYTTQDKHKVLANRMYNIPSSEVKAPSREEFLWTM